MALDVSWLRRGRRRGRCLRWLFLGNEGHFALEEVSGSRQSFDLEFALLQQFDDHLGVLSSALQELLLRLEIRNKWELAKSG